MGIKRERVEKEKDSKVVNMTYAQEKAHKKKTKERAKKKAKEQMSKSARAKKQGKKPEKKQGKSPKLLKKGTPKERAGKLIAKKKEQQQVKKNKVIANKPLPPVPKPVKLMNEAVAKAKAKEAKKAKKAEEFTQK